MTPDTHSTVLLHTYGPVASCSLSDVLLLWLLLEMLKPVMTACMA